MLLKPDGTKVVRQNAKINDTDYKPNKEYCDKRLDDAKKMSIKYTTKLQKAKAETAKAKAKLQKADAARTTARKQHQHYK